MGVFDKFKQKPPEPPERFPPVPAWRPSMTAPLDDLVDRMRYYTGNKRDLVVFKHGTCVVVDDGHDDSSAADEATRILAAIFNYHPDMNPMPMDDGNVLVTYNYPAYNVVIAACADAHWAEIESRHLDALATSEVLMTPLGANKFDKFGKLALYGRCFFFMDAQAPEVVRIVRH